MIVLDIGVFLGSLFACFIGGYVLGLYKKVFGKKKE